MMHVMSLGAVPRRIKPVQFGYITSSSERKSTTVIPPSKATQAVDSGKAALWLLQNWVVDPMPPVERGMFERAYRASIGLQPGDSKSLPHTQRSALDEYVQLPAHGRLNALLALGKSVYARETY